MKPNFVLAELLEKAFNGQVDLSDRRLDNPPFSSRVRYHKGDTIIMAGDPVIKAHLVLKGKVSCIKYTADGRRIVVNDVDDILYGLDEVLTKSRFCYASIVADTEVEALRLNARYLEEEIRSDLRLSNLVVDYLMRRVMRHMTDADDRLIFTDYQNFLLFLAEQCRGQTFPVKLRITKMAISDVLGINLRTTYRYIKKVKEEGLVSGSDRVIEISEDQYEALLERIDEN